MAGYVHGKPGHDQPRQILARNPECEVGAFLSVLLAVANNLDPLRRPRGHITDDMFRSCGQLCIYLLLKVSGTSCLAMSARPCTMPCGSGPDLPYPPSSDTRGAAGLRELRPQAGQQPMTGDLPASAVISSSPRSGPMAAKIREGSGRHASERSGGSRSWKRNDHNGEAVRAAD